VIMLIAITVVIAAVVAAFAYGIIGGVKKAPSCALVVEGAVSGFSATNVTIIHHGGDKVLDAFAAFNTTTDGIDVWGNLEVRFNGAPVLKGAAADDEVVTSIYLNEDDLTDNDAPENFIAGDELHIAFGELVPGDSITIVFTPTQNVLQRITVT